jgi:hypothetical protein
MEPLLGVPLFSVGINVEPFSLIEVKIVLRNLKNGTAAGIDGLQRDL